MCHPPFGQPRVAPTSGGFSLFELVVVVIIISIFFVAIASRLWGLQVDAERAAMEQTVGVLDSAIGIKVATHIAQGDIAGLRTLDRSNPMNQLAKLPKNYLGEVNEASAHIEDGNWYFDTRSHYLVYLVRNKSYFISKLEAPARARFVLQLVYEGRNENQAFDPGINGIAGLQLVAVEPYTWAK
jgi:type II secretory pathway pseudopilin PulG